MANRTKFTARARKRFLKTLEETGIVTDACISAGISRTCAYMHKDTDPDFAAEWKQAEEISADILEREARRRAVEGCRKPLVSSGRVVKDDNDQPIYVQEYSDTLLALLLKARRRDVFGDQHKVELSNPPGEVFRTQNLSDSDLERIAAGDVAKESL